MQHIVNPSDDRRACVMYMYFEMYCARPDIYYMQPYIRILTSHYKPASLQDQPDDDLVGFITCSAKNFMAPKTMTVDKKIDLSLTCEQFCRQVGRQANIERQTSLSILSLSLSLSLYIYIYIYIYIFVCVSNHAEVEN
jgi:hypothetical protein